AEAYARGEIGLDRYRGRSAYSPAVQAAEDAVRRRHGLTGLDDLEIARHQVRDGGIHGVDLQGPNGERYAVEVEVGRLDPRLLTCKATHPHAPRAFKIRSLETVED
ncbi:MAG: hypothetical protein ACRDHM_01595, partial [Actinomycetota bacterium]